MMRLGEKYEKEAVPVLMKELNLPNRMAVPRIEKVVVNTGFGKMISGKTSNDQKSIIAAITQDMALITGQKPVITKARKSISGFKIRKGMSVGAAVTLRGKRMYDFLERLIHITLPRSRDFAGLKPDSLDKKGNLTFSIKEHISFPEILPEKAKRIFSLEITVVTSTEKKEKSLALLKAMGFPMRRS
jgi:large subunit ribosomal protein L5